MFNLVSKYSPSGDQPNAINELVNGIKQGKKRGFKKRNRDIAKNLISFGRNRKDVSKKTGLSKEIRNSLIIS